MVMDADGLNILAENMDTLKTGARSASAHAAPGRDEATFP